MNRTFKQLPRMAKGLRFVSWIVETSPQSTTNPMTKGKAVRLYDERKSLGQYAELIRCYTCVSAKNLERGNSVLLQTR